MYNMSFKIILTYVGGAGNLGTILASYDWQGPFEVRKLSLNLLYSF